MTICATRHLSMSHRDAGTTVGRLAPCSSGCQKPSGPSPALGLSGERGYRHAADTRYVRLSATSVERTATTCSKDDPYSTCHHTLCTIHRYILLMPMTVCHDTNCTS